MTIDPNTGGIVLPEIGLALGPALTRAQFLRSPTGATSLPRVRHDPSFRYQLPAVPQPDSALYIVLRFDYERLATVSLFHHAERFDDPPSDGSEARELARKSFHEHWLASQFGLACQRYRWGEVSSDYDSVDRASSILVAYAKANPWQTAGRTAGRLWGAVAGPRRP